MRFQFIKTISNMKLKTKIRLIIISMIVPILLLTFLSLFNLIQRVNTDLEKRFATAGLNIRGAVEILRRNRLNNAKMIAGDLKIQSVLQDHLSGKLDQDALLQRILTLQPQARIEYSWLYDKNGAILIRGHRPTDKSILNDPKNKLFLEAKEGKVVYSVEYKDQKDLYLKYAVPIFKNKQENVIGVLVVGDKISPDLNPVLVSQIRDISGVEILLIADNKLVSTSFGIPISQGNEQTIFFDIHTRRRLINNIQYDLRKVDIWPVFNIKNFGVLIALDNTELYEGLKNTIILILVAFVLATTLAYFISRRVSRNILNSAKAILKGAEHIKNRNFQYRIPQSGKDEFTVLTQTFNSMSGEILEYSEHMETLVDQRTRELNEAFEKLHELKVQQDGDYFLTSLLINPLLVQQVDSRKIQIETFISQKKKFQFRHRQGEIGGDLCIANTITLRGRKYIVFANGDAMGKSLQGAGGALVMSVVFNSYITRTRLIKGLQENYPERWLKQAYQELQNIFTSFDGSMMISAVIGLIDEETGFMCYFNAEHPWSVLYRNKQASFTNEELLMRKIGIERQDEEFTIRSLMLKDNDTVIIGSDGRDDIVLDEDEKTGQRIINFDEREFLKKVEKADGDLNQIVRLIHEHGQVTDDISLMKISFHHKPTDLIYMEHKEDILKAKQLYQEHNYSKAYELLDKITADYADAELINLFIDAARKEQSVAKEAHALEMALNHFPENMDFVFRSSLLHKKLKDYDKALDYGERMRFYHKKHVNNLINLADVYRLVKNYEKMIKLLDIVEKLEPHNKNYKKLREYSASVEGKDTLEIPE